MIDASVFASLCAPVPAADFIRLLQQTGFSAEAYRDAHGDLAALNWNATQALSHFFLHGLDERRVAPMILNHQALVALVRLPLRDAAFKTKLLESFAGHLFDHAPQPFGMAIQQRWSTIQALTHAGARPYFIAGDSHTYQYVLTGTQEGAWLLPIHLLCVAASATGLGNPASRSGYGSLLRQAVQIIETLPGADEVPFLAQFGQVDIEFVYHFRRIRNAEYKLSLQDYRAFCDATAEQYIQFVTGLFGTPPRLPVTLVSVFPPALSDAAWQQGYVNAEVANREATTSVDDLPSAICKLEVADLRQRTEVHACYNETLRSACRWHGFGFVDGMTPFLGADGTVNPRYLVAEAAGADHHLNTRATPSVLRGLIWNCIDACRQAHAGTSGPRRDDNE